MATGIHDKLIDELTDVVIQHPWLEDKDNWPGGRCPTCQTRINAGFNSPDHARHIAGAIVRRLFPEIATVQGLNALPNNTAVTHIFEDGSKAVWVKDHGHWYADGCELPDQPYELLSYADGRERTVIVLHRGENP